MLEQLEQEGRIVEGAAQKAKLAANGRLFQESRSVLRGADAAESRLATARASATGILSEQIGSAFKFSAQGHAAFDHLKATLKAGLEGVDGAVSEAYNSVDGPGGLAQKFNQALEEKGNLIRTYHALFTGEPTSDSLSDLNQRLNGLSSSLVQVQAQLAAQPRRLARCLNWSTRCSGSCLARFPFF